MSPSKWSCDFCHQVHLCDILHLLICICWIIPASNTYQSQNKDPKMWWFRWNCISQERAQVWSSLFGFLQGSVLIQLLPMSCTLLGVCKSSGVFSCSFLDFQLFECYSDLIQSFLNKKSGVHVFMWTCVWVPWCTCGGQRTSKGSQFSPSTMWEPDTGFRLSA